MVSAAAALRTTHANFAVIWRRPERQGQPVAAHLQSLAMYETQ
jgi:hypothetical protein